MSPRQRPAALEKFALKPRLASLRQMRTLNGAVAANRSSISTVELVEQSSHTTISSGGRSCAARLASCLGRYCAPL